MPIIFNGKEKRFSITTANSEYQIAYDGLGVLKHLWYGAKVCTDMSYLLDYHDVGFSGNVYDAGTVRTYSLDTLPLEYPCRGTGDCRIVALSAEHAHGGSGVDLRYQGYEIKSTKYSIPGMPSCYGDAGTLELTLSDKQLGLTAVLRYGVFEELDVITRSVVIKNEGNAPFTVSKAASMCLDLPRGEYEWVHFAGRHVGERTPQRAALIEGIQESSSIRGASSHQQNPSFIICGKDCTETDGECYGAMLLYSGCFQTQVQLDQLGQTRAVMGINPEMFSWRLEPGEAFYTPEAVVSYSGEGFGRLSKNFHRLVNENITRGKYKAAPRPVLINSWEAAYFNFTEKQLLSFAKEAAGLGMDMFVLDDGWFGKRNDDFSGLGDWSVNTEKLPGGLDGFAEELKKLGLSFGLWLEPEMVSEDSGLYRTHPEWALKLPDRNPVRCRYQLVLDLSRKEVEDYLFDVISGILKSAEITYVKWDMNRNVLDWYSPELGPGRMKELPHRYVLGLYSLLERLTSAFPDVLFEGCCGGGGRFDAGMLYYTPQIWCSDNTDAYDRSIIQYGTSFFYPPSTMASHVSAVPNHQNGRVTPLAARAAVAMAGSFGYELDPGRLSKDEKEVVKAQIAHYKENQQLVFEGDYYRLSDPTKDGLAVWEFVSKDKATVLVQGIVYRTKANALRRVQKLRGLDGEKTYHVEGYGLECTGAALMQGGLLLPETWGDYCAVEIKLTANQNLPDK